MREKNEVILCVWLLFILVCSYSMGAQQKPFTETQVLQMPAVKGKPASLSAHLSAKESDRFCDSLTQDYISSDQVLAIVCDDRHSPIRASIWIREVPAGPTTIVKDTTVKGKKFRMVSIYGADPERLYDNLELDPSKESSFLNNQDFDYWDRSFREKPDEKLAITCKSGRDVDGKDVIVANLGGRGYHDYCFVAISLENVPTASKKAKSRAVKNPPSQTAPKTGIPKQDEVIVNDKMIVFKDHQNGLEWALEFRPGVRQAQVSNDPREASGVCSVMGYQLPGINAFMETPTKGGKLSVSKHQMRKYWPKLADTFMKYIPAQGKGCRFYTHNVGPFPVLGESVVLFQPYSSNKWDFYSLKQRAIRAYVLCFRQL